MSDLFLIKLLAGRFDLTLGQQTSLFTLQPRFESYPFPAAVAKRKTHTKDQWHTYMRVRTLFMVPQYAVKKSTPPHCCSHYWWPEQGGGDSSALLWPLVWLGSKGESDFFTARWGTINTCCWDFLLDDRFNSSTNLASGYSCLVRIQPTWFVLMNGTVNLTFRETKYKGLIIPKKKEVQKVMEAKDELQEVQYLHIWKKRGGQCSGS